MILLSLAFVRNSKSGSGILESGGMVWEVKYALRRFAFSVSELIRTPFSSSGGMLTCCLLP